LYKRIVSAAINSVFTLD